MLLLIHHRIHIVLMLTQLVTTQVKKRLGEVFKSTRFGAHVPMIPVSACVGAALPLNAAAAAAAAGVAVPADVFDVKSLVDHLMANFRTLPQLLLLCIILAFMHRVTCHDHDGADDDGCHATMLLCCYATMLLCCYVAALPVRGRADAPLLFAVDHCFPIKGQGTVLTGTVLAGSVRTADVRSIYHDDMRA